MKKKVLLIMGMCILLLAGGCSKNGAAGDLNVANDTDQNSESSTDITDTANSTLATVTGMPVKEEVQTDDYIKLGEYKGIAVTYENLIVTDADVDDEIDSTLESATYFEKVDKTKVENGDWVNIDFEGIMDGVAFDNGSATDYDLEIGSSTFIEGFEEGLIGAEVGKQVAVDLTFPEDYGATDLAGKAVTFNVTVNQIEKQVTPTLEDYVKNNTDYKTADEYKQSVRESLEADNEDSMKYEKYNNAFTAIMDAAEISSVPTELSDYYVAMMNYQLYLSATNSGTDVATYLTNNNMTVESYNSYVASYSESYAKQDLLFAAIAKVENITITDDEYNEAVNNYMTNYGYESEEELLKSISEVQIKDSLLSQKVMDFVVDNAVVTEATPTPEPTVTTAAE